MSIIDYIDKYPSLLNDLPEREKKIVLDIMKRVKSINKQPLHKYVTENEKTLVSNFIDNLYSVDTYDEDDYDYDYSFEY